MSEKQYVQLWNEDPTAVAATRATIEALPGGPNRLGQDEKGFYVTGNLGFLRFALVRQGYVKALVAAPTESP